MSTRRRQSLWAVGILIGTVLVGLIWFALAQPLKVLPRIRPAPAYALTTVQGESVHSELMRGGLTFYTFTSSACDSPAFTAQREALQSVVTQANAVTTMPIRVVTMMVDGKDCTGEVPPLPYEIRLVGNAEPLKQIIGGSFGVYYAVSATQSEIDPVMVLVDGWGIVRAEYRTASPNTTTLWRDVQLIVDEVKNSKGIARYAYEAAHLFLCYPR